MSRPWLPKHDYAPPNAAVCYARAVYLVGKIAYPRCLQVVVVLCERRPEQRRWFNCILSPLTHVLI